jgi:hypothetical protein
VGMVEYAVEYGYYAPERDLTWSRKIDPHAYQSGASRSVPIKTRRNSSACENMRMERARKA